MTFISRNSSPDVPDATLAFVYPPATGETCASSVVIRSLQIENITQELDAGMANVGVYNAGGTMRLEHVRIVVDGNKIPIGIYNINHIVGEDEYFSDLELYDVDIDASSKFVAAENYGIINSNGSSIDADQLDVLVSLGGYNIGIYGENAANIELRHSTVRAHDFPEPPLYTAYYNMAVGMSDSTLAIADSRLEAGGDTVYGENYALYEGDSETLSKANIIRSTLAAAGGGMAAGIYSYSLVLSVQDTEITASGGNGNSIGLFTGMDTNTLLERTKVHVVGVDNPPDTPEVTWAAKAHGIVLAVNAGLTMTFSELEVTNGKETNGIVTQALDDAKVILSDTIIKTMSNGSWDDKNPYENYGIEINDSGQYELTRVSIFAMDKVTDTVDGSGIDAVGIHNSGGTLAIDNCKIGGPIEIVESLSSPYLLLTYKPDFGIMNIHPSTIIIQNSVVYGTNGTINSAEPLDQNPIVHIRNSQLLGGTATAVSAVVCTYVVDENDAGYDGTTGCP